MRAAVLAIALCGCNQLYGIEQTDIVVVHCMSDDFADGTIDPAIWTILEPTSPMQPIEQNGHVELTIPAQSADAYNGLISRPFDITGGSIVVKLTPGYLPGFTETTANLEASALSHYRTSIGVNTMTFSSNINNNRFTQVPVSYTAALQYLRYRHDADAMQIVFETSPDRTTWTEQHRAPEPYSPSAAQLTLVVGGFQTPPETSTASYDDVQVEADNCEP